MAIISIGASDEVHFSDSDDTVTLGFYGYPLPAENVVIFIKTDALKKALRLLVRRWDLEDESATRAEWGGFGGTT